MHEKDETPPFQIILLYSTIPSAGRTTSDTFSNNPNHLICTFRKSCWEYMEKRQTEPAQGGRQVGRREKKRWDIVSEVVRIFWLLWPTLKWAGYSYPQRTPDIVQVATTLNFYLSTPDRSCHLFVTYITHKSGMLSLIRHIHWTLGCCLSQLTLPSQNTTDWVAYSSTKWHRASTLINLIFREQCVGPPQGFSYGEEGFLPPYRCKRISPTDD